MQLLTYIPEFGVVLTRRCIYSCGYCNFPQTASPPLPSLKNIKRSLRTADRLGALQITLIGGDGAEKIPEVVSAARYFGYRNYFDYLFAVCETVLNGTAHSQLFPILEVGRIPAFALRGLREVVPAVRLLLGSADDALGDTPEEKSHERQLEALEELGELRIPAVTGILIGLGEKPGAWRSAARNVLRLHRRHHHIQRFVLKPFRPLPFSPMAKHPPASDSLVLQAVRTVREEIGDELKISAELQEKLHLISNAAHEGISDIGPIRVGTAEQINVDANALLDEQKTRLRSAGVRLCARLPIDMTDATSAALPQPIQMAIENYYRRQQTVSAHGSQASSDASIDCA